MRKLSLLVGALALALVSSTVASTNTFIDLTIGPEGILVGVSGDVFRVSGSFDNGSTNNIGYNIINSVFEFTGSGAHNLEQAGQDLGPCAGNISNNFAFGTLKTAGTVTVVDNFTNSPGNAAIYAQVITGSGTLAVGAGMRVYFGTTNGWVGSAAVSGNGIFRPYLPDNLDFDGDGIVNSNECLCGTDSTNSASALRITSIVLTNNDVLVSWAGGGGRTNVVQSAIDLTGSYTNISPNIVLTGNGDVTTNYLDACAATNTAARFYRIRLVR
jgi:hypothetical protein